MIKEIKYKGFTATPSDYECPDGDLSAAINLVPEDGMLTPIQEGSVVFSLDGYDVIGVYIHQNNYKHFIVVHNDSGTIKLAWKDEDSDIIANFLSLGSGESFVDLTCVGNTIIITSDKQFYFVLWRNEGYEFLGNRIPDVKMAFALDGEVIGHTYTATDMTFSSGTSGTTTEEEWIQLYGQDLSFSNVPGSAATSWPYSEWQELNWSFSAGVEYRFSNGTSNSDPRFSYCVQGWDGTQWVAILGHYQDPRGGGVRTRRTDNGYKKTFTTNYSKIRVCVLNAYTTTQNFYFTLEVFRGVTQSATYEEIVDKTQENLDALLAKIQHFTKTYVNEKERFIYPFFVRYAVRLYDQTYGYISTPVLMIPNSGCVPMLNYHAFLSATQNNQIRAYAFVADLQYAFLNTIQGGWEDVIDGIDIFVSQPIYTYHQDPKLSDTDLFVYKILQWQGSSGSYSISLNEIKQIDYGNLRLSDGAYINENYFEKNLYDVIVDAFGFGSRNTDEQWNVVQVSPKSNEEIMKDVESVQNYYLIHGLNFRQIIEEEAGYHTLKLEDDVLYSGGLVNRTRLEENMLSYRTPKSAHLFSYNNRLHAFSATFKLPVPIALELQSSAHFQAVNYVPIFDMFVFLRTSEGDKIVKGMHAGREMGAIGSGSMPWFYYPDGRAYKVWRFCGSNRYQEILLKKHDFLPGAYWAADALHIGSESQYFDIGITDLEFWQTGDMPTENNISYEPHKIFISNVDNPFVFVDGMTADVGCNVIFALSTAAKALSQGQFGQFPLYAFTDNGVWALEVSNTGTVSARQPITRDVSINPKGITQLDNAVLFTTDRGIMLLSGSESACISDSITSEDLFSLSDLPRLSNLSNDMVTVAGGIVPFMEFLPDARMHYDYTHQRIIVYNPEKDYAYVYSLKSKQWGMMQSDIKYSINSYPDCLAVDGDNNIINLSSVPEVSTSQEEETQTETTEETESETENEETTEEEEEVGDVGTDDDVQQDGVFTTNALLVTRPIKLDTPDLLKTVDTIIQRGYFRKGHLKTILYGSRDLFNWHLIYSSNDHYLRGFRGTPYKYFRIVLLCELSKEESIDGCTVQFTPRLLDQPR